MRILGSILMLATLAAPVSAQEVPSDLSPVLGTDIYTLFSGRTMDGTYKDVHERSGTKYFIETFHENGRTDYQEGNIETKGWWAPKGNQVCFRYLKDSGLSGELACYRVFQSGTCIYSYNPALVIDNKPVDPNYWSAKTILKGDISTCDNLVG